MSFRQKVAAIKREHRKRQPQSVGSFDALAEISRRFFIPRMAEQFMRPSLLGVLFEKDRAGGVWRDDELAPHEIAERSRQYSVLRELEGA